MSKEIDDSFNWIILILTTISGFLIDLPKTAEVKKVVASGFIVPLLAACPPILFFRLFVLPIYRADYEDSGFLASPLRQALLYIFATLTSWVWPCL